MSDNAFGTLSEAEIQRIASEVSDERRYDRAEDIPGMTFDINDDELFAIDRVQRDIQERYARMPSTESNKKAMSDELVTRLAEVGFEVVVAWKNTISETGVQISYPDVTFIGRFERESLETDHDRKRFDALRLDKHEIPNSQLVD